MSWPLVIAITLLFFYRPIFNLLEKFSSNNIQKAKIGPFEIQESEQAYVESLKLLLTSLVTEGELSHLQQLNDDKDSPLFKNAVGFREELKRLAALGFINVKTDFEKLPEEGELEQYIELTEKGKKYLTLRENILINQSSSEKAEEE
ncbi:MAG: hypothetical protein WA939_22770 [Nodosilinea sp.]